MYQHKKSSAVSLSLATYPSEDSFDPQAVSKVFRVFCLRSFFSTSSLEGMKVELLCQFFYLFNSWQREILAIEGKSVLPMPIGPFLGKGGSIT